MVSNGPSVTLWDFKMPVVDVIDSHVHLYPQSELSTLAWCHDGHVLHSQHSVEEYIQAIRPLENVPAFRIQGFIFVETDRKSNLDPEQGWEEPLKELDWITRVAEGTPRPNEGHSHDHASLCLAIVLWAPVPLGSNGLSMYYEKVKEQAGKSSPLIKGFRYLVQDKTRGTMLTTEFIDSLRWMGVHGLAFELGVDARSGGLWQLSEASEMIHRAHSGVDEESRVGIVISGNSSPLAS